MRKNRPYLLLFLAILLAVFGCDRLDNSRARLGEEFYLSLGQHIFIAEENLEIRFEEVLEDSRCPRDMSCIWPGRVSCIIEFTRASSSYRMVLTEPGLTNEYSREKYETYELVFHITPYPEADRKIPRKEYRLHLIVNKLPQQTKVVGSILNNPFAFEGQDTTIVGHYRGWDLLQEANTAPPVTRSDWVIKDLTGAIYVSAHSPAKVPEELHPGSLQDTSVVLKVKGIVRVTQFGQPYIEATSIECVP